MVEFGTIVDPAVSDRVLALDERLSGLSLPGMRELVPTYRSLLIHYDPLLLPRQTLCDAITEVISSLADRPQPAGGRQWVLPCCYEGHFAEDLDEVAGIAGLSRQQVVTAHSSARYRIYMYGFAPAYCYLGGLAESLQIPRRKKPRPPHAAGAVLIGGGLASITTFAMPTGWYVVGRTPVRLYDPRRTDPFPLRPGDGVRFRPIPSEEFQDLLDRANNTAADSIGLEVEGAEAKI